MATVTKVVSMNARSLRASAAALARVSQVGGATVSAPAREARWQKYLDQVDPDRRLPEGERVTRALAARKSDMMKLAAKSAATRAGSSSAAATDLRRAAAETLALADDLERADGAA